MGIEEVSSGPRAAASRELSAVNAARETPNNQLVTARSTASRQTQEPETSTSKVKIDQDRPGGTNQLLLTT